jgi:hypothetical protein
LTCSFHDAHVLSQTIHRLRGFVRRYSNILTSSGLVSRNALALTGLAKFGLVGYTESPTFDR